MEEGEECDVGQKTGEIAATYSRDPTTVDGQTDIHAGVLYLQSSV